jgi:hypothetical protein
MKHCANQCCNNAKQLRIMAVTCVSDFFLHLTKLNSRKPVFFPGRGGRYELVICFVSLYNIQNSKSLIISMGHPVFCRTGSAALHPTRRRTIFARFGEPELIDPDHHLLMSSYLGGGSGSYQQCKMKCRERR